MATIKTGRGEYRVRSFSEAVDAVLDERRERQDIQIPISQFSLSLNAEGDGIVGTINGVDYAPTMHCMKQLATWTISQYMPCLVTLTGVANLISPRSKSPLCGLNISVTV